MIRIAIVIGSTRPGRRGEAVARWVEQTSRTLPAVAAGDVSFDVVDIAHFGLPLLDEAVPARFADYRNPHTTRWAATVDSFDGFLFVTPEYNHSFPGALKNALDYLYAEWHNKAAGFVSYGVMGGVRAAEQLRLVLAELKVATVRAQVALSIFADFTTTNPTDPGTFTPSGRHDAMLVQMLDEVVAWSRALRPLRDPAPPVAATA